MALIRVPLPKKISLNQHQGRAHWTKRQEEKDMFLWAVKGSNWREQKPIPKDAQVHVHVAYYLKGKLLDWDNCTAMTKHIQDALVKLGILHDDSPKYIPKGTQEVLRCPKGQQQWAEVCLIPYVPPMGV